MVFFDDVVVKKAPLKTRSLSCKIRVKPNEIKRNFNANEIDYYLFLGK